MREPHDAGSVTVLVAVLVPALLLVVVLVVDGAGQLRTISRADALAAEAARAAQTAVDTRGETIVVDTASAVATARSYLAQAGYSGTVTITGPDTVRVTVTVSDPAVFGLGGSSHTATGTATAQLGVGTSTPGGFP